MRWLHRLFPMPLAAAVLLIALGLTGLATSLAVTPGLGRDMLTGSAGCITVLGIAQCLVTLAIRARRRSHGSA